MFSRTCHIRPGQEASVLVEVAWERSAIINRRNWANGRVIPVAADDVISDVAAAHQTKRSGWISHFVQCEHPKLVEFHRERPIRIYVGDAFGVVQHSTVFEQHPFLECRGSGALEVPRN